MELDQFIAKKESIIKAINEYTRLLNEIKATFYKEKERLSLELQLFEQDCKLKKKGLNDELTSLRSTVDS